MSVSVTIPHLKYNLDSFQSQTIISKTHLSWKMQMSNWIMTGELNLQNFPGIFKTDTTSIIYYA